MVLTLFATKPDGTLIANGGGIPCLSGTQIIIEELNQFSPSSAVIPASWPGAVEAMAGYTKIRAVQDGLDSDNPNDDGTIGQFVVVNARQTVSQDNQSTITLDLRPLPVECTWERTGPGWKAVNKLSVVASRIASLTPGWTGTFTGAGTANDVTVSVPLNNPTILAGFLETAKTYGQFARQGVDATGVPTRALEMGQFGAAPTVTITDPKGADVNEMATNAAVKPVVTVDRTPNDVTNLVNVVIPYGGGQDAQSLVTLERCWRILNDPRYVNYGRYGTDAESIARTGLASLFPEYDPNYPISDPRNPPTFVTTYWSPPINPTAAFPNGDTLQGALGTRGFGLDGRSLFYVYDNASYIANGHKMGEYIDSGLTYADNSVANQELTARALYVSTITNFKRRAHGHHSFSFTAPGIGRPTRAGDLIAIDVQRVSVADTGAIVEMDINTWRDGNHPRVMSATRAFGDGPPMDTIITSNVGRFEDDDQTAQAEAARALVAIQRQEGTGPAPLSIHGEGNADALHPLIVRVPIPAQLFRWYACSLGWDFYPYRATAATAVNSAATITLSVPHGDHNLDGTFAGPGGQAQTSSDGFSTDLYVHVYGVNAIGAAVGAGNYPQSGGNAAFGRVGNSIDVPIYRNANASNKGLDASTTATSHTVPIKKGVLAATTLSGPLPQHTHPLDQRIPDGPTFPNVTLDIDGVQLSSGIPATNGMTNPFTGSAFIADVNAGGNVQKPGQVVTLTFTPGTSAQNPYGTGYIVIYGTWFGEFGGLTSTVQIS